MRGDHVTGTEAGTDCVYAHSIRNGLTLRGQLYGVSQLKFLFFFQVLFIPHGHKL